MINFVAVKILTNDEKNCSEHFWGIFMQLLSPLSQQQHIKFIIFFLIKTSYYQINDLKTRCTR